MNDASAGGVGDASTVRTWHTSILAGRLGNAQARVGIFSQVFAGQCVGIREVDDQIWLVSFMHYDLGFFDQDEGRIEPAPNPFAPETVLTMSPE